jgi:glycosyltransferase involved in cell wall biosynthesis
MLLLDLSHTSHTQARTGIQRVSRSLHAGLGRTAAAITHDPYLRTWRKLAAWEHENLAANGSGAVKRGAQWPWSTRFMGKWRRKLGWGSPSGLQIPADATGLIVPEFFSPAVGAALPELRRLVQGPAIAVFHDAIALRLPELTPSKTVARYPGYLQELLQFDGIAATTDDTRDTLVDYWKWLGADDPPPVVAIRLGVDPLPAGTATPLPVDLHEPVILSVGSIEGRKNHAALLEAAETLWAAGRKFRLHLVGSAVPETAAPALARIEALQAAGRPLRYDGPVDEAALHAAYAGCVFTVYPSVMEGFGIPVIESLEHERPCICSGRGALGESARGGGCLPLDSVDAASLAAAMGTLLDAPERIAALAVEARGRTFPSWADYTRGITDWLGTLRRK